MVHENKSHRVRLCKRTSIDKLDKYNVDIRIVMSNDRSMCTYASSVYSHSRPDNCLRTLQRVRSERAQMKFVHLVEDLRLIFLLLNFPHSTMDSSVLALRDIVLLQSLVELIDLSI